MPALRLGSLFDGIGVFPLAASRCGIVPVWASEIARAPVSITRRHFPDMLHLGDITQIDGCPPYGDWLNACIGIGGGRAQLATFFGYKKDRPNKMDGNIETQNIFSPFRTIFSYKKRNRFI